MLEFPSEGLIENQFVKYISLHCVAAWKSPPSLSLPAAKPSLRLLPHAQTQLYTGSCKNNKKVAGPADLVGGMCLGDLTRERSTH